MRHDEAMAQLQRAADAAAVRGSLLFHLDLATELARNALAESGMAADDIVTIVDGDGYGTVALSDGTETAWVRFAADGRPIVTRAHGAPSRQIAAMARARRAVEQDAGPGRAVIVVPSAAGAPIEAYTLTRSANPGDIVVGTHWRVTLDADGRAIADRTPLTRADLVLPSRPELPPMALDMTHFDAVPGEIHHYLSLKHGIALQVATLDSALVWRVDGERVTAEGMIDS